MSNQPHQLALGVALSDGATLDNFFVPEHSPLATVRSVLRHQLIIAEQPFVYLWGSSGSGVSHLLKAACHQAIDAGLSVQYLPLDELASYPPSELLEGLERISLVCLDNIHAVVGVPEWEQALFHCFNRLREQGNRLLVGANASARELPVQLADLQSRLNSGLTFSLPSLDDEEKRQLLQFCALQRGMEISESAASYLLSRAPRNVGQLIAILDQLDSASLQAQRKLTVPFIKATLNL